MAANFIGMGDVITFTAGAALSSGDVVVIGDIVAVVQGDVANGAIGQAARRGIFQMPAAGSAVSAGEGARLYFDGTELTTTATSNDFAGWKVLGDPLTPAANTVFCALAGGEHVAT